MKKLIHTFSDEDSLILMRFGKYFPFKTSIVFRIVFDTSLTSSFRTTHKYGFVECLISPTTLTCDPTPNSFMLHNDGIRISNLNFSQSLKHPWFRRAEYIVTSEIGFLINPSISEKIYYKIIYHYRISK